MIDFSKEMLIKNSRSSGSGGQNVNKVETAVTVFWEVNVSNYFNTLQKNRILDQLKNRINSEGFLIVNASEARTQLQNKKIAIQKTHDLVQKALVISKLRLETKIPFAKKIKRLDI